MGVLSRTQRRRRDTPRATQTVVLGLIVVAISGALALSLLRLYNGVPTANYKQAFVSVPTVGNLLAHDAVRVAGKRVGQVLDISVGPDGRPRVELQLDPGTKMPADTGVRIRANGLLGARYVELTPGNDRELLAEGATISGGPMSYTFGLPEAVDTFDKETRGGLREMIGTLGAGTLANGAPLNFSVKQLGTASGKFDQVAREVLSRRGAAARLLPSFASAFEALDRTNYAVRAFTQAAGDAVQPFVTEREATRATLTRAPAALSAAQDGLRRGRRLLTSVRSFSTEAALTLPSAPEGLRRLSALLRESQGPLRRAAPSLARLAPGVDGARITTLAIEPVAPHVKSGVDTARPILDLVGKHACDVADFGAAMRSMTGFGQTGSGPNGPAMGFRLQAMIPNGLEAVGVKDTTGLLRRDGLGPPCKYLSKEFPQFVPKLTTGRASR